ncbi:MAG TPA: hypothetical protein VGN57_22855 [Pirellulaceae bacterium]|jgi:hypothetical protein|nr:hypothetical protein [Pirellulaceae bacterium]
MVAAKFAHRLSVAALLCVAAIPAVVSAADAVPAQVGGVLVYRVETEGEAKVREALDKPLTLEADQTSLQEFVSLFANRLGVPARIETSRLEDYGIATEDVEFVATKGTPARVLLDDTLPEHNLGWTIQDDALVVTVGDEIPYRHRQRIYDITALAARDDDPAVAAVYRDRREAIVEVIEATVAPEAWERRGGMGSAGILRMNGKTLLVVSQSEAVFRQLELFLANLRRAAPASAEAEAAASEPIVARIFPLKEGATDDDLVDVTKEFVAPDSWTEEGVSIRRTSNVLLVRHRPAVQAQVRAMLASMGILEGDSAGDDEAIGRTQILDDVPIFGGGIGPIPAR